MRKVLSLSASSWILSEVLSSGLKPVIRSATSAKTKQTRIAPVIFANVFILVITLNRFRAGCLKGLTDSPLGITPGKRTVDAQPRLKAGKAKGPIIVRLD
jgi:hypothetical protein